ncbi:MAG TPA: arginine deiminase-related protein [Flavobacterium sp.]|nr:arginine deiminase-related protein [Flavobacterium sp.]
MKQVSNSVLMIRPVAFRMNEQTQASNHFQKESNDFLPSALNAKAQQEFDNFVAKLQEVGVNVVVVEDTLEADTPDSIFPNNWISFHENGDIVLYPMFAENRREERRDDILDLLEEKGFLIENSVDFTSAEEEEIFLEGTGSVVLDRVNNIAYCALSSRTNEELFIEFCEDFDCAPVIFEAFQMVNDKQELVCHTDMILSIGEYFAIICADMIVDKTERKMVLDNLRASGKEIILITEKQVNSFAGNILEVANAADKRYIVMSTAALESLSVHQKTQLEKYGNILSANLDTIETHGGGSVRSMMAEIFLPKS